MIPKYLMKSPEMRQLLEFAKLNKTISKEQCFQFYASSRLKRTLKYLEANNLLRKINDNLYAYVTQEERENVNIENKNIDDKEETE